MGRVVRIGNIGVLTLLVASLSGLGLASCDRSADFLNDGYVPYEGEILGAHATETCPEGVDCSFLRRGFSSATALRYEFDANRIFEEPGSLSTSGNTCGELFDATNVTAIEPLRHDLLSLFEFPGRGRVRNYIMVARPTTGPAAGRDVTVVISLMRGGAVEARVISGSGERICDPGDCASLQAGECDFFGVFTLRRADS